MDDQRIIELYFRREEKAIEATDAKYGKLLNHIAFNILRSAPDSEECVNDTYMRAWQAMPPQRPSFLKAFLAKITRNLSINRYLANKSRGRMLTTDSIIDEFAECVPATDGEISEDLALRDAINSFLGSLGERQRIIFVKRYFYMCPISEIASDMSLSSSNVKVTLMRTRDKFREYLEKAGITV